MIIYNKKYKKFQIKTFELKKKIHKHTYVNISLFNIFFIFSF
jgi:hypothetical protein